MELEKTLNASADTTSHADLVQDTKQSKMALHNLAELEKARPSSYCLVLDNPNIRINAAEMTSENQNKDHHWCNHNAVFDRVNPVEFSDDKPLADILDLPNRHFASTRGPQENNDFAVLVSRVFVEFFPSF